MGSPKASSLTGRETSGYSSPSAAFSFPSGSIHYHHPFAPERPMTRLLPVALVLVLAAACAAVPTASAPANLVKNAHFTEAGPAHYTLAGAATAGDTGRPTEFSPRGVALRSHQPTGGVSQTVSG